MGGIKIGPGNSRRDIEKKLEDLEKQKDEGHITLEEYDTLRIRFERKLGNREAVSKLQERKGFKPSKIAEKKAIKEELYDDFVDKYAKRDNIDAQKAASNSLSGKTKGLLLLVFVLVAFTIGIAAGMTALQNQHQEVISNITISDSAFISNATLEQAKNLTQKNNNMTSTNTNKKTTTKKSSSTYKKNATTSSNTSSGSGSSSSSSGSSGSSSSSNSRSSSSSSGSRSSGSSSSGSSR
ncbi:MAG: hypothetical protein BZ137_06905 [Methanosphaera sp. rholeuAM130]|nr:MAG: hypothetical protein BZ137_06905 [Methanosphaera sp. rholeuAM130]